MQPKGRIIIVADLGHSSPRVPGIFSELALLGWEVDFICPRVTLRKKDFFLSGIQIPTNFKFHFTGLYYSNYKIVLGNSLLKRGIRLVTRQLVKLIGLRFDVSEFLTRRPNLNLGVEQHKYWVPRAVKKAHKLVARRKQQSQIPTIVISSSSPFSAHIAASIISAELGIPWIADYRDLWALNHSTRFKTDYGRLDFERAIISRASRLVTVSEQLKQQQSQLFEGKIRIIHNGFVKRSLNSTSKEGFPKKIVYTGSLYREYMDLRLFLSSLEKFQLGSEGIYYQVIFAGSISDDVAKYYYEMNRMIPDYISVLGELSRQRTYELQQGADIGLIFGWEDREFNGSFPTKFFEYLGSGLHVLFSGGHEADECAQEIIRGQLGTVAHSAKSLLNFFDTFCKTQFPNAENGFAEKYSYSNLAKSFELEILDVLGSDK